MWVSQDRADKDTPSIFVPKVIDIGPHDSEILYVVPQYFALWDDTMKAIEGPINNTLDGRALASGLALGHSARTNTPHLIVRVGQNGRHWMDPKSPLKSTPPESAARADWGEF